MVEVADGGSASGCIGNSYGGCDGSGSGCGSGGGRINGGVIVVVVMVLVVVMMVVVVVNVGIVSRCHFCELLQWGGRLFISLVSMQHAQFACVSWAGTSGSHVGLWARPAKYRPVDAVRS